MVRRIRMAIVIGGIAVLLGGTAALATPPSGLTSTLLARGSLSRHDRIQLLAGLPRLIKPRSSDVAMVRATLDPCGTTGWHDHPGPSVVILAAGTLTISEAKGRGCRVTRVGDVGEQQVAAVVAAEVDDVGQQHDRDQIARESGQQGHGR
jgi:hypothetical protein